MPKATREATKRIKECESAMAGLRRSFQGNNRFGAYGDNIRAAYARWASVYENLTGNKPRGLYD